MGAGIEPKCLWVVLELVLVLGLLGGRGTEGCLEQERLALLQLKLYFNQNFDPFYFKNLHYTLYNWVEFDDREGSNSSDCCKWERVECDPTTQRVIGLSLSNEFDFTTLEWYLNASMFLPFKELKTLSLSGNLIAGCLHNQGFEKLAPELTKLQVLDLSNNYFNESSILSSLLGFSSLKSLNLSNNRLSGTVHTDGLRFSGNIEILDLKFNELDIDNILFSLTDQLSSIKYLDLSYNQIIGSNHNNGLKRISRLRNLETLYLSGNYDLKNNIISYLGDLSSLKILGLEDCGLNGTFDMKELNNLTSLKELYLSGNEIESLGSFHDNDERQSRLTNLELLDLTLNFLNSSILSSFGPFSKSLKHLRIIGDDRTYGRMYVDAYIDVKDSRGSKNLKGIDGLAVLPANDNVLLILQSLALFQSLKTIHLQSSWYDVEIQDLGSIQLELRNLTNLEELYMEYDILFPHFLEDVGKLTSLKVLSVFRSLTYDDNHSLTSQGPLNLKNLESLEIHGIPLENSFLQKIGGLTSLKILTLSWCGLNGTLSSQDICQLTRLQKLDLKKNKLWGVLPDCFSDLKFLAHLDLSFNQFSGNLTMSPLQSLTSIEYIDLSNNQFQIPSSLKPLYNHSKLKHFNGNNNYIFSDTELHYYSAPRFQLNVINLSCCGDVGSLPKFLHHQSELQIVDLSNLNLTGEFPSFLLENNTELETLALANNSLSGHFRLPFHSPMKLQKLDVSSNSFDGHIPEEIGVYLPSLFVLNISRNSLDGSIPASIGDMKLLQRLDLSQNRLSGVIPEHLAMGCSSLMVLVLSDNNLRGQIFSVNLNLKNLYELRLAGNNFTGLIPSSLSNCSFLSIIDIGDNHISGRIPSWMGNLTSLSCEIIMPNNHIEGPIPLEFCQLNLGVLDLSMNNLSGTIPSCFGPSSIYHIHLFKNRLQGSIPESICNSSSLVTLDLSHNQLTGKIPDCVDKLWDLRYLVLKHNNVEGRIPHQFCQLEKLSLIDLSHNNLSGHIPNCLNVSTYEENTVTEDSYNDLTADPDDPPHTFPPAMVLMPFGTDQAIELTTKSISYSYKGRPLTYLSGIDLSSNNLNGEIPHEMGNLHTVVMLNLSHNSFTGTIPPSFSNLRKLESLDLSYNELRGSIPFQLVELNFLAYFNVSYNNLSGKPPPRTAQFATDFDINSYWGNPLLCGEPLPTNCSTTPNQPPTEDGEDATLIDMESFYVTFTISYIVVLLTIFAILYINPHWRRAWFYYIELTATSCLYFVVDNLPKPLPCCNI